MSAVYKLGWSKYSSHVLPVLVFSASHALGVLAVCTKPVVGLLTVCSLCARHESVTLAVCLRPALVLISRELAQVVERECYLGQGTVGDGRAGEAF